MILKSHKSQNQLKLLRVKAARGKVVATFKGLKPGKYAISLYHDADKNTKMNMGKNSLELKSPKNLRVFEELQSKQEIPRPQIQRM